MTTRRASERDYTRGIRTLTDAANLVVAVAPIARWLYDWWKRPATSEPRGLDTFGAIPLSKYEALAGRRLSASQLGTMVLASKK